MSEVQSAKRPNRKVTFLAIFSAVLLIILTAFVVFFFIQYRNDRKSNNDDVVKSEQIIKKVGKLYVLPSDDQPTVARIENQASLPKDQEFYQNAENGDYVLVYTKAKIALLYRESIDKLVRVSPVIPTAANSDQTGSGVDTR